MPRLSVTALEKGYESLHAVRDATIAMRTGEVLGWVPDFSAPVFGRVTDRRAAVYRVLRIDELGQQHIDAMSEGQHRRSDETGAGQGGALADARPRAGEYRRHRHAGGGMSRVFRQVAMVGTAMLTVVGLAQAQLRQRPCPNDTTATWYTKQRAWLDESKAAWSDTALRNTLLRVPTDRFDMAGALYGYEVHIGPDPIPLPGDSAIIARLTALAAVRGSTWPTRSVVGPRGVLAVWMLASRDTAFARIALKRMMETGPDELPPAAAAILEDRTRLQRGRKQLYGTQFLLTDGGEVHAFAIEDLTQLELRRAGAALPPMTRTICAMNEARGR